MSTEGSSFGFNSLIPQTYKNKAEAFAKCLQDKLMLLGGYNDGGENLTNGKSKRLNSESDLNGKKIDDDFAYDIADNIFVQHPGEKYRGPNIENKFAEVPKSNGKYKHVKGRRGYSSDSEDSDEEDDKSKTENFLQDLQKIKADETENYRNGSETSDLVLNSHKQSEILHKRVHELINNSNNEKPHEIRKLQSVSSEESTVDSWCSCDDHDVYDSDDKEEMDYFASQIKGSPKLKSTKLRNRRRWNRSEDESWRKLPLVNYSPVSGPDVFADFDTECFSPVEDPEESEQLLNGNENEQENQNVMLLDGLDMENYDVPYRILRESSSANNLEKHFSQNNTEIDPIIIGDSYLRKKELLNINSSPTNLKPPSPDFYSQLLTPPPSPEYPREENSTSPAAGDYVVNIKELEDGGDWKEEEEVDEEVKEKETDQRVLIEETSNKEEIAVGNFETEEKYERLVEDEGPEQVEKETVEDILQMQSLELSIASEQHEEQLLQQERGTIEETLEVPTVELSTECEQQLRQELEEPLSQELEQEPLLQPENPEPLPQEQKQEELSAQREELVPEQQQQDELQQQQQSDNETIIKTDINFADIVTEPTLTTDEAQELIPEPTQINFTSTFTKKGGMVVECPCDSLKSELCCGLELPTLELQNQNSEITCSVQVHVDEPDTSKTETKFIVESVDESSFNKPTENGLTIPDRKNSEDDDEEMLSPRLRLRRCSSLKTWKTPPGTPGRKKIVRFADALGLDLADVRTFLDEIPKIPSSAYEDLNFDLNSDPFLTCPCPAPPPTMPTLIPSFSQPGGQIDFLERVKSNSVSLESAVLTDTTVLTISGIIRVRNLDYNKSVHVRYSLDNWLTFSDLQATYVPNSCDGFSDKFSFVLYGHTLKIGQTMEFAIRLECLGRHFWDNNEGKNYVFQCLPQSPSTAIFTPLSTSPESTWTNKFY